MPDTFLTAEVVAAVVAHMNDDHAEDNVAICRGVGGHPDTQRATMTGVDVEGADFEAVLPSGPVALRVPFSCRVESRAEVRTELVAVLRRSEEILAS